MIAIGTALVVFCQYFGGAVFVALGQTAFINRLSSSLQVYAPEVDAQTIIDAGATAAIRSLVPKASIDGVLTSYNHALTNTFVSWNSSPSAGIIYWPAATGGSMWQLAHHLSCLLVA
jgi:hypothetical protein